ncbi:MAG: hypothetical protein HY240_07160 [Actinobacteria bacterium]|nr:hypothetical protein [Actinomycetota bacterium]
MEIGIFFLFALVAGVAAYLAYYFKQKRIKELGAMASHLGLEFSRADPFDILAEPFQLLCKGDGQGVENVMWGTWQGVPLRQFDFWYYEESTGAQGQRSKTYHRFNCVVGPIDAACSHLTIDHENLFTRLADSLSFHDIEFESEEFNRSYQVKCRDKKFANDFVDARMMQWLLAHGEGYSFEAAGDEILCAHGRLRPTELIPLMGTAKAFSEQVPRIVFELYPKG